MQLLLIIGGSGTGKTTFITNYIKRKGRNLPTFVVNYGAVDSFERSLRDKQEESVIPTHWKRISWAEASKLHNCNLVFEDLVAITSRERSILARVATHNAHHFRLNVVAALTHRLYTTGCYSVKKHFTYHLYTRDLGNVECFQLSLRNFVRDPVQRETLIKQFESWCKRSGYSVLVWHSKQLRFIPESQIKSTFDWSKKDSKSNLAIGKKMSSTEFSDSDWQENQNGNKEDNEDDEDEENEIVYRERRSRKQKKEVRKNTEEEEESDSDQESQILALLATVHDSDKAEILYKLVFKGMGIKLNFPDYSFIASVRNNDRAGEDSVTMERLSAVNYITYLLSDCMIPEEKYLKLHSYIIKHLEIPPSLIVNPLFSGRRLQTLDDPSSTEGTIREESKNKRILVLKKPDFAEPFVVWKSKRHRGKKKKIKKRRKKKD